jgi:hypothetical protein
MSCCRILAQVGNGDGLTWSDGPTSSNPAERVCTICSSAIDVNNGDANKVQNDDIMPTDLLERINSYNK